MKTKFLTLLVFIGVATLMVSSCAFLRGTGSVTTDSDNLCSNYSNTQKSELKVDIIHKMTDLYQNNTSIKDAHAIRLDLTTLKAFLYHIEIEAKKNNVPSQDLGVRIYFGRYPDKTTWNTDYNRDLSIFLNNPITEQYEGKQTVLMIPTKKNGSNHDDFDPFNYNTYNGFPQSYTNPLSSEYDGAQLMFVLPITPTSTGAAQNHGQMYPPYPMTGMGF